MRNLDESAATSTSGGGGATTSSIAGTGSAAACEIEGGVSTRGTEVIVSLSEWKITPNVTQVKAGIVSLLAENTGQEDHELVVVKGDSADALPKDATGAMDEAKLPEGALIGEIEPFAAGQLCRGNFALPAGSYVLLCNIAEKEADGTTESHFAEGMHTTFTVGAS
ncbi:MAG: hypothetical protein ACRD0O_19550 [Acidimicrobiia bacterium]